MRLFRLLPWIALTLLLAPTTLAVSEKRFLKALQNRDYDQLERYFEGEVSEELKLRALHDFVRRQDVRGAEVVSGHIVPDEASMDLAVELDNVDMIRTLTAAGGRFRDKEAFYDLIRQKNKTLALAVLDAGEGLHEPDLVTGLLFLGWEDRKIIAEKYERPAMSALYVALENGLDELARALIEAGADPGLVIHETAGHADTVNLDTMAVGERVTFAGDATATFHAPRRTTMLVNAVRDLDVERARLLLDAGAPVAIAGDVRDLDACFFALKQTRELEDLPVRLCPWYALREAIWEQDLERIQTALDQGIDVNKVDYDEKTALHVACSVQSVEIIRYLIARGARTELPLGRYGSPPIVAAARRGSIEVVRALLEASADPDAPDAKGRRAIHVAQNVEIVRLLVEAGADITATNGSGVHAMVTANEYGDFPIVDYLRGCGLEYGPEFSADDPEAERYDRTSNEGHQKELVLVNSERGRLTLRGQLAGGKVAVVSCQLSDPVRDARYFHAPSLVEGRTLPPTRPFATLRDEDLAKYVGLVVRVGAVHGKCASLAVPTAEPVDAQVATPEQLAALLEEDVEFRANVFDLLVGGRMTQVFPGKLVAFEDAVVTVELTGGLRTQCKLDSKTGGILYGLASVLERTMAGHRDLDVEDAVRDGDLRKQVGKRVKVGPGTGRCAYFELLDAR